MRPPREDYVRVTVVVGGSTIEPGVEWRDGDRFDVLAVSLRAFALKSPADCTDQMERARWVADCIARRWPDRAYFVEVWQDGEEGFAQVFQPFGVPRNPADGMRW